MTRRGTTRHRSRRLRLVGATLRLLPGCAVAALALSACGSALTESDSAAPPPKTRITSTFPTSITTASGTWASVPMGHLGHPLNTFWQLFFLPGSGGAWKDHAGQLAVADNGGLLLGSSGDGPLVVVVRPSNLLKYSVVALTTANGRSWKPGPAIEGDAASLAASSSGGDITLVEDASGGKVLVAQDSGWRQIVTDHALASTAGTKACAPVHLTAVGMSAGGDAVVGASCATRGLAGVFVDHAGAWRSIGPRDVPSDAQVSVLELRTTDGELSALFSLSSGSRKEIVAGWQSASGAWRLSRPLPVGTGASVVSIGPDGDGEYVLYRLGAPKERLAVVDAPAGAEPGLPRWTSLPDAPAGTETVAFPSAGGVDALSVDDTVMTDWTLTSGASRWSKHQAIDVTMVFGSST